MSFNLFILTVVTVSTPGIAPTVSVDSKVVEFPLELLAHEAAHVMTRAAKDLPPSMKVTVMKMFATTVEGSKPPTPVTVASPVRVPPPVPVNPSAKVTAHLATAPRGMPGGTP